MASMSFVSLNIFLSMALEYAWGQEKIKARDEPYHEQRRCWSLKRRANLCKLCPLYIAFSSFCCGHLYIYIRWRVAANSIPSVFSEEKEHLESMLDTGRTTSHCMFYFGALEGSLEISKWKGNARICLYLDAPRNSSSVLWPHLFSLPIGNWFTYLYQESQQDPLQEHCKWRRLIANNQIIYRTVHLLVSTEWLLQCDWLINAKTRIQKWVKIVKWVRRFQDRWGDRCSAHAGQVFCAW